MFSFPHIFFTLFSTVVRLFEAAGTVIFTAEVSRSDLGYPKQDRSRRGKSPIGGAIGVLSWVRLPMFKFDASTINLIYIITVYIYIYSVFSERTAAPRCTLVTTTLTLNYIYGNSPTSQTTDIHHELRQLVGSYQAFRFPVRAALACAPQRTGEHCEAATSGAGRGPGNKCRFERGNFPLQCLILWDIVDIFFWDTRKSTMGFYSSLTYSHIINYNPIGYH